MKISASNALRAVAAGTGRLLPPAWRAALERDPIVLVLLPMLAAALLMRLSNAIRYPSLRGFDSYGHATYIWHVLRTWTVPLASDGWGRFHPPLYYWLSAGLWELFGSLPPETVLKILGVIYGAAGLGSAVAAMAVARRYFGQERAYAWAAGLSVLFLPVHIYTAPMLGNEGLSTVLCSVAVYLLVRHCEEQTARSALRLGIVLGLAMLTKFTAIVIVGSTGVTLALWALLTRRYRPAILHLTMVMGCMLALSGWFYGRNVMHYGNPFQMSRDYFATKRIESTIDAGQRNVGSYLKFDTGIFRHPSYATGPVLDSVWAGVYATAWFDAHGGWFFPSALYDSLSYRIGKILMVLGLAPTILVLLGLARGLRESLTRSPDPVILPMVVTTACMMAMFVIYTFENRIYTAVKASYLLPAIVPFAFWFALGLRVVARWATLALEAAVLWLLGMAAFILPVYTYQVVFEVPLGPHYWNTLAVLDAFAGFPDLARQKFEAMTKYNGYDPFSDLYLGHENLATMALEENDPYRALVELRRARGLVTDQAFGQPQDITTFLRDIDAEYSNSLSVIYDMLGWTDLALASAMHAVEMDPTLPEGRFDEGMVLMKLGKLDAAVESFERAVELDPGFADAHLMLAAATARAGRCREAADSIGRLRTPLPRRTYPHEVGTGELHDAAILRRRNIETMLSHDEVESEVAACRSTETAPGT